MKRNVIFLVLILALAFTETYSQEKIEIEGAMVLGNAEDPNPTPGTIRWTGLNFEGWNGFTWVAMTTYQVTDVIADIDGNEYRTVSIGTQEWMAENLRTSKYQNGDALPEVTNDTDWGNLGSGAWCWYNNDSSFEQPYGKLYNQYAVQDARGLCPAGWHVPSEAEFTVLIDYVGGLSVAGGALKEVGTAHFISPNIGATNSYGFTGLPGGVRSSVFSLIEISGSFWSSTETDPTLGARLSIGQNSGAVLFRFLQYFGISVRCVKD